MRGLLDSLAAHSAIVYTLPESKADGRRAEELRFLGLLERARKLDGATGIERWAYRRTDAGSEVLGASCQSA